MCTFESSWRHTVSDVVVEKLRDPTDTIIDHSKHHQEHNAHLRSGSQTLKLSEVHMSDYSNKLFFCQISAIQEVVTAYTTPAIRWRVVSAPELDRIIVIPTPSCSCSNIHSPGNHAPSWKTSPINLNDLHSGHEQDTVLYVVIIIQHRELKYRYQVNRDNCYEANF